jgi:cell division protein FtsL
MEIVKKQEDLILLYQDKSGYTSKRIKTLERQAELTAWEKVLYFTLGVVAAGAAVYAAK